MESDKTEVEYFGLREAGGKKRLVRIETDDDGHGDPSYALTMDLEEPEYRTTDFITAARALMQNPAAWASNIELPSWGRVDVSKLEIVSIKETREFSKPARAIPVRFAQPILTQAKTGGICGRYLQRTIEEEGVIDMHLVRIPDGETLESLQAKCTESDVFIEDGLIFLRKAWGVIDVLEEFQELTEGKPCVHLFAKHGITSRR